MTNRIKESELIEKADMISGATGAKYQIGMAYGGYRLEKVIDGTSGCITSITGYSTKRELNTYLDGFLSGLNLK